MTHPNMSGSKALMAGLCTNYEGARGPRVKYKRAPPKRGNAGVWRVAWYKKVRGKKVIKRKMKKSRQKRRCKLWQKKSWRKLT